MKKILVLTLAATFLLGSLAFAAAKKPVASKAPAAKGDVTSECQDFARKEMIGSDRMNDFMKQCSEKLEMERKGDANYPATGKITEGKNTKPVKPVKQ
jgi:hypothetical protein